MADELLGDRFLEGGNEMKTKTTQRELELAGPTRVESKSYKSSPSRILSGVVNFSENGWRAWVKMDGKFQRE
jgi:hypothetical protein